MKKLFLTGLHGKLILVDILGDNPNINDGIYIRYPEGGTDTTTPRFLYDIPEGLVVKKKTLEQRKKSISEYRFTDSNIDGHLLV